MKSEYRIQERKFSSNIVEVKKPDGNFIPYIAPLCRKDEGDEISSKLVGFLIDLSSPNQAAINYSNQLNWHL